MLRWMMAGSMAAVIAAGSAGAVERAEGAVDLKVADDVWSGGGRFSGIDYATSERFHRAWLVLHYMSQGPCLDSDGECDVDHPVQVSVPGLVYDPAARRVVYEGAGAAPVICANVRRGGFLGARDTPAATGQCTYRLVKVDRLLDDGFGGQRDRREEVHFAVEGR